MAADHAAKSQRQRRGRGIDEADCSSLRHYSPNDRRKRADAQLWRLAFGVWRLAFGGRAFGGRSLALDSGWFQKKGGAEALASALDDRSAVDQIIRSAKISSVEPRYFGIQKYVRPRITL
jgi:hypothetical protein